MSCSLPSNSNRMVCFITKEMQRSPYQYPIGWEKTTKPILWEEHGKLVSILFPKYGWFCGIPPDSYPMVCFITWKIYRSFHQYVIARKNVANTPIEENLENCHTSCGKSVENWYPYFSQSIGGSLPSDDHPVICFIAWEMHDFFNQFFIAWENSAKSIPWERTRFGKFRNLFPIVRV